MNLLVIGACHRTAPVEVLERLSAGTDPATLSRQLLGGRYVNEVVVLSTCNRVEVYAEVSGFHGGLAEIANALAAASDSPREDLSGYLYVRHEVQAVRHAFAVASGLDSLVPGESQILGQLRDAYEQARQQGAAARVLHEVMQQALRVGKRVHAETQVDEAGPSVVTAALGEVERRGRQLAGANVLIVGAGAMGALTAASVRRLGGDRVMIANRDLARAHRVAENHDAQTVEWDELGEAIREADVVVSATGAARPVLEAGLIGPRESELYICDLAVPRDVAGEVASLPGVTVLDIAALQEAGLTGAGQEYVAAAEQIVAEETEIFSGVARSAQVAPTVAALRTRADEVVDAELSRLRRRTPQLSEAHREELAHTVHRVVQRLLHQPTVRVRQLASEPGGEAYATALRELFLLESPELQSLDGAETTEALRVTPMEPSEIHQDKPH